MKTKILGALAVTIALAMAGSWLIRVRAERARFLEVMEKISAKAASLPALKEAPESFAPLAQGSPDRAALFAVRKAYDQLRLDKTPGADDLRELESIAQGLVAMNPIVRATTEDIVRHLLTAWVRSRSPSEWHRSAEIDSFFRAYVATKPRSLEKFLKIIYDAPEGRYVAQIEKENT